MAQSIKVIDANMDTEIITGVYMKVEMYKYVSTKDIQNINIIYHIRT